MIWAWWRDSYGSCHYGVWWRGRFIGYRYQAGFGQCPTRGPELAVLALPFGSQG